MRHSTPRPPKRSVSLLREEVSKNVRSRLLDSVSLRATWRNLETVEIKPTQTAPEAFRGFSLCWWCSCLCAGGVPVLAAVFCPLCGSLWLCWCGVCSCCPAVVGVYSIDRGGGWCRLGLPSNYDSAPTDRHTPKTAERRQAAHDGGRRTASKRPGGLNPRRGTADSRPSRREWSE